MVHEMTRIVALVLVIGAVTACGSTRGAGNPQGRETPGPGEVFFATQQRGPATMEALYRGPLSVRNSCVMIGSAGQYTLPVWPEGFTADVDGTERLIVRDGEGSIVAVEGERFSMGGGYAVEFEPASKVESREVQLARLHDSLGYEIPAACLGEGVYGVWIVGETSPRRS